jgi:DNA-binding NarL/FixJ family response regulator
LLGDARFAHRAALRPVRRTPRVTTARLPGRIRVVLVEDHSLVRRAVREAVSVADIEVVGEADSGEAALDLVPRVRPDVLLLDIGLPGISGLDVVRDLALRLPATRIVMLTASGADPDVLEAMQHGAAGFLTKDVAPEALVRAVRGAFAGDLVVPRQMAARLVRSLSERARAAVPVSRTESGLSEREAEILRLLADGYTDREIADRLTLSPRTVETHVGSVLRKLGVANRREAARRYRTGL